MAIFSFMRLSSSFSACRYTFRSLPVGAKRSWPFLILGFFPLRNAAGISLTSLARLRSLVRPLLLSKLPMAEKPVVSPERERDAGVWPYAQDAWKGAGVSAAP